MTSNLISTILVLAAVVAANLVRISLATPTPTPSVSPSPAPTATPLSLFVNNDDGMTAKITWSAPKWRLSVNEADFNISHSDPNEVSIYFVGTDGSRWKATGWTKQ